MRRDGSFASTGLACLAILFYTPSLCSTQVAVSSAREQQVQDIILISAENDQSPKRPDREGDDAYARKKRPRVVIAQKESYDTASPETTDQPRPHSSLMKRRRQRSSATSVSGRSLSRPSLLARRNGTVVNFSLVLASMLAALVVFWRLGNVFWKCLEHGGGTALKSVGTTPRQLGESDVKPKKQVRFNDCMEYITAGTDGEQAEQTINIDDGEDDDTVAYERRFRNEPAGSPLLSRFVPVVVIAAGLIAAACALTGEPSRAANHTATERSKEATAGTILGLALFSGVAVNVLYIFKVAGLEAWENPRNGGVHALSLYKVACAFLFLFITSFLILFSTESGRVASGGIYLLFVAAAAVVIYLIAPLMLRAYQALGEWFHTVL